LELFLVHEFFKIDQPLPVRDPKVPAKPMLREDVVGRLVRDLGGIRDQVALFDDGEILQPTAVATGWPLPVNKPVPTIVDGVAP
jgi:hypothetical protein